jgi:glycosyltransferase involved in cell wall biosynthesis
MQLALFGMRNRTLGPYVQGWGSRAQVDPTIPLFGFIGRLEEQKGVDILLKALPAVLASGDVQVVILGTGKKALETQVKAINEKFAGSAAGVVKFSAPLAHLITAGEPPPGPLFGVGGVVRMHGVCVEEGEGG